MEKSLCLLLAVKKAVKNGSFGHKTSIVVRFSFEPIKHLRAFDLGAFQSVHIQAECCQDSWRYLFGADLVLELGFLQLGIADEAGDMSVVVANTTVFSNLRLRICVDDAELRADDDVGNGSVGKRVTESLRDETLSKYDILDL
jgi:hypothetical protein